MTISFQQIKIDNNNDTVYGLAKEPLSYQQLKKALKGRWASPAAVALRNASKQNAALDIYIPLTEGGYAIIKTPAEMTSTVQNSLTFSPAKHDIEDEDFSGYAINNNSPTSATSASDAFENATKHIRANDNDRVRSISTGGLEQARTQVASGKTRRTSEPTHPKTNWFKSMFHK